MPKFSTGFYLTAGNNMIGGRGLKAARRHNRVSMVSPKSRLGKDVRSGNEDAFHVESRVIAP